jgi:hypothetical protein
LEEYFIKNITQINKIMTEKKLNYFEQLNNINVQDKIEKKGNLSYLSWAFAWEQLKIKHPKAQYKIYEREDGIIYWTDGKTAWVKVSATVDDMEHIEYLPIMDYKNKSIPVDQVSSFNVNTSIQRALTKAIARHGLGLYIYAGEDIPSQEKDDLLEEEKKSLYDECKDLKESIIGELEMAIDLNNLKLIWEENAKELKILKSRMPKMHEAVEKRKDELKTKLQ